MSEFDFDLGDDVKLSLSGESGIVIGRADFAESDSQYYVRYLSANGRQVEDWWNANAVLPINEE